ncbi:MAG: hypothetical protein GXO03_06425 [Aquificae bacterium]|nr:hypothetical protein [Aquificota bacterium]
MAYLVFKGASFWRKRWSIRLRDVKTLSLLGWTFRTRSERYVKKGPVLIVQGGFCSGKTRELKKIEKYAKELYGKEAVYIPVGEALTNWYKRAGLQKEELKGLTQFEKNEKLIQRCKGKVVVLDDIDRAESKVKTEVVKWLIRVAKVAVVSCRDVKKVHPSLEYELRKKLKLKNWQGWDDGLVVDLGKQETEVKDVGLLVGIILVVFVAMSWGLTHALLGALGLRWLMAEAKQNK